MDDLIDPVLGGRDTPRVLRWGLGEPPLMQRGHGERAFAVRHRERRVCDLATFAAARVLEQPGYGSGGFFFTIVAAQLTATIGNDVESRACLVDDLIREASKHVALDVPGFSAIAEKHRGTHHLRPLPPFRTSSTATCCLSNVRSEKSWKRHLPPSHELIVWMYASPSERGPEKHSWNTTIAGEPGGPAVMMMLVYSVRGEPLMQSRT